MNTATELPADARVVLQFLPSAHCVTLDLLHPVVLGRGALTGSDGLIDLTGCEARQHGVSRRHCLLKRDGRFLIERAVAYANQREVFGGPIGANQGVQFPIADAWIEVEAANLMRWKACELIDARKPCGAEANMAKYLAAKASWEAANVCLQTHGGFGFACEYDIERKFRETRLYQVAPISTNMIFSYIAEHVLGLPRSF